MNLKEIKSRSRDAVQSRKVLTLDNYGVIMEGVLTGFETQHGLPLVKMGDKEFFCMGVILPYTKELHSFMESIDKKHRWALFSDMTKFSKNIERAIGN